ncbi:hypothetical protein HDU79_010946 [Rhizoclosmatium sp. JEL0117]|nr:hypothetical protein HDU79_010946 [Rhizoclosmatium sp. JEL0117]
MPYSTFTSTLISSVENYMTILDLVNLTSPGQVEILPTPGSSSLIYGYLGLSSIRVEGIIRIRSSQPIVSVSASLDGKIFTSNGDARKHSPYEAFSFLTIGPDEVFADDGDQDARENLWNAELKVWDIPFKFPISWGGINKIHDSISASNPEWGFGARISYHVEAIVKVGTKFNKSSTYRQLELNPYFSMITSSYERFFMSTLKSKQPIQMIKYSPQTLKAIVQSGQNARYWSSESDLFGEHENVGVGHNFDYSAFLSSTVFGPGDKIKFEFRIRPKPKSRIKITSVRVSLEEVQGVGISADSLAANTSSQRQLQMEGSPVDLVDLMSGTTLDRKYLSLDLLSWKGEETVDGEFWNAIQELTFEVPRLASGIPPPSSIFETKHYGINPSGQFANRVNIEHKFRIRVNAVSSRGDTLPPFDLPVAIVQVVAYSSFDAENLIMQFPQLLEEVVRESKDAELVRKLMTVAAKHELEKTDSKISLDETFVGSEVQYVENESGESETECEWVDAEEN